MVKDQEGGSPVVFEILKKWHKEELDFENIIQFKNLLFSSELLNQENQVPLSEFKALREKS